MASTNHTEHYNLPQWEATDPFKREDFNDAFQKIDTEIKGAGLKMAFGSYTATGKYTEDDPNILTFDFEPKMLIITRSTSGHSYPLVVALRGQTAMSNSFTTATNTEYATHLKWEGNTVSLWATNAQGAMNYSSYSPYFYFAIG